MRITFDIDESLFAEAKSEAARQGCSVSDLINADLQQTLRHTRADGELPPIPSFDSGGALVDVADRNALYDAMEDR